MTRTIVAAIVVLTAAAAHGQTPSPSGTASSPGAGSAQAAAPAPNAPISIANQVQGQYSAIKGNLTKLADKMPEDGYAFKPTADMRTFAQSVAHAAATNFSMCANLTGKPNPMTGVDLEKTSAAKADATKALRDSFAFCDEYMSHLSSDSMAATYQATAVRNGERTPIQVERGGLAGNLIGHNDEMYGYLAVYLRLKGIVPPTSEPRPGAGRGGR